MEYQAFKKYIIKSLEKNKFKGFDDFIISELGFESHEASLAWKEFRKKTNKYEFASIPTMRKWFGLNGHAKPSRENVFEMCFRLGCDLETSEKFLTKGINEPSFQANDYIEMVYMYGIENGLSYEKCQEIIEEFEEKTDIYRVFDNAHTTLELFTQYNTTKYYTEDDFLEWLLSQADWFRGYSKTSLDYMSLLRSSIINNVREEAREYVKNIISDESFTKWKEKRQIETDEEFLAAIKKYTNRKDGAGSYVNSEQERKYILEMAKIAFSKKNTNAQMLAEVFNETEYYEDKDSNARKYPGIRRMTGKYLCDLFNIPIRKEIKIKFTQLLRKLNEMSDDAVCPEWATQIIKKYLKLQKYPRNVGEARKFVEDYQKENKRRTLLIQRSDILPLIHHLSQQRYFNENKNEYSCEIARQRFIDFADKTLNACFMESFNREYELDFVLYESFQKDEMFSYSEILDALYGK